VRLTEIFGHCCCNTPTQRGTKCSASASDLTPRSAINRFVPLALKSQRWGIGVEFRADRRRISHGVAARTLARDRALLWTGPHQFDESRRQGSLARSARLRDDHAGSQLEGCPRRWSSCSGWSAVISTCVRDHSPDLAIEPWLVISVFRCLLGSDGHRRNQPMRLWPAHRHRTWPYYLLL
jgi:hypothetical protein